MRNTAPVVTEVVPLRTTQSCRDAAGTLAPLKCEGTELFFTVLLEATAVRGH